MGMLLRRYRQTLKTQKQEAKKETPKKTATKKQTTRYEKRG